MPDRRSAIQEELHQNRPFASRREEAFLALLRTAAVVKRPVAKVIEGQGLSLAQYNVLRILRGAGEDGLPTLAIRERMIEEAAGITRLIDKLESAGFVRRERSSPGDRRQVICRVSGAGRELLARVDACVRTKVEGAMDMLDEEQLESMLALLDRIRSESPCRAGDAPHDALPASARP
jgi:DNA-binding MarR family transcriptional regulator